MRSKAVAVVAISLLVLLIACGEAKTEGKRVAVPETSTAVQTPVSTPTAAVTADTTAAPAIESVETGQTAAEALKELQANPDSVSVPVAGDKTGTFYPPISTSATGAEALKEKTRALFQQDIPLPDVEADDQFGQRFEYE